MYGLGSGGNEIVYIRTVDGKLYGVGVNSSTSLLILPVPIVTSLPAFSLG
jgi:hypothetical protein